MAIPTVTITGNIVKPGTGDVGVYATITATPQTRNGAIPFAGEAYSWGPVIVDTNATTGAFSMQIPVHPDMGADLLWRFTAKSKTNDPPMDAWLIGNFPVTSAGRFEVLLDAAELTVVSSSFITQVIAARDASLAQADRAEVEADKAEATQLAISQQVITDLGTTDSQSNALVRTLGSLTEVAIKEKIAVQGDALVKDAFSARINLADVLGGFRTALGNASTAPVDIVAFGTSITEGYKATHVKDRFTTVMTDLLRADYQPSSVVGGFGYHPTAYAGVPASANYITLAGTTNKSTLWGHGARGYVFSSAAHFVEYTVNCTGFDLTYAANASSGTFEYRVDGGAYTTVTATQPTQKDGKTTQVRGLTAGSHVIRLQWKTGTVVVGGIMVYNGDETKGVRMWEAGHSSWTSGNFRSANGAAWLDYFPNPIEPDLVLIELSTNDYYFGSPVATMKANAEWLIGEIRARAVGSPAFVLLNTWERPTAGGTIVAPWSEYRAAYKQIAAANADVALIDLAAYVNPGAASAAGGLLNATDMVHPTDAGHLKIGQTLAALLAPQF